MNRALPPGDRGNRKGLAGGSSRYRGALPGVVRLVGGVADPHQRATKCGEVNQDEREAGSAIGTPGRNSRCRRSREGGFRRANEERLPAHPARGYVQTGNESLAETAARAFGMNSQELRHLMAGPVEAFNAKLQSL